MNRANSKKKKLSKRGTKPHTHRRIVTGHANGKAVVQSDESLLAYEFKTVPGYEHTLIWVNPATPDLSNEQRFDRYPDSVVPGPGGTSLHFVTFHRVRFLRTLRLTAKLPAARLSFASEG